VKIFISGSGGFIGSNLSKKLSQNYEVISCSTLKENKLKLQNFKSIENLNSININDLDGVEVLIHAAAVAHKNLTKDTIKQIKEVNIIQTQRLFRLAVKAKVKRIIFLSSVAVYGNSTEGSGVNESSKLKANNYYAESKKLGEDYLKTLAQEYPIKYSILRLPMVYGAGAPGSFLMLKILSRKRFFLPIPLLDNDNKRTLVNIDKVIEIISRLIPSQDSEVVNIANSDVISTFDLLSLVLSKKNKVLRLRVGKHLNYFLLRFPFINSWYEKYYSSFVVKSKYNHYQKVNNSHDTLLDLDKYL
jgi:nucleoside-diphosphate-sugar epimerase